MNVYIAARFSRSDECEQLARRLEALGHCVVSTWHTTEREWPGQDVDIGREVAEQDLADLDTAECCVCLVDAPEYMTSGGHHVEFGYSLADGKIVCTVGAVANVFHCLPQVIHFPNQDELVAAFGEAA